MRLRFGETFALLAVFYGMGLLDAFRAHAWPDPADPYIWLKGVFFAFMLLWAMRVDGKKKPTDQKVVPTFPNSEVLNIDQPAGGDKRTT